MSCHSWPTSHTKFSLSSSFFSLSSPKSSLSKRRSGRIRPQRKKTHCQSQGLGCVADAVVSHGCNQPRPSPWQMVAVGKLSSVKDLTQTSCLSLPEAGQSCSLLFPVRRHRPRSSRASGGGPGQVGLHWCMFGFGCSGWLLFFLRRLGICGVLVLAVGVGVGRLAGSFILHLGAGLGRRLCSLGCCCFLFRCTVGAFLLNHLSMLQHQVLLVLGDALPAARGARRTTAPGARLCPGMMGASARLRLFLATGATRLCLLRGTAAASQLGHCGRRHRVRHCECGWEPHSATWPSATRGLHGPWPAPKACHGASTHIASAPYWSRDATSCRPSRHQCPFCRHHTCWPRICRHDGRPRARCCPQAAHCHRCRRLHNVFPPDGASILGLNHHAFFLARSSRRGPSRDSSLRERARRLSGVTGALEPSCLSISLEMIMPTPLWTCQGKQGPTTKTTTTTKKTKG